MEIEGKFAVFTVDEQAITGCPERIDVTRLDVFSMYGRLTERTQEIIQRKSADDDEIFHEERAAIIPDSFQIAKDKQLIDDMVNRIVGEQAKYAPDPDF